MAVFKCKMCGGTIEFEPGSTVGVCDSCGTKQTLPRLDDDRKANLYDRANHFRRNNDFDKAMGIYETILNDDNTDAEAYWSLVLCRYGIEYVEDPETHRRIPTVNRAQYTSIFSDEDYKSALQYADGYQREIYEQEAKAIDEIQKGILEISRKEEPFDVFISFKETDANGRRTRDAVLAQELYNELTKEGFKVFFAPVTLEDKLGTAYEPYIFAALNSSKVMVVLGTKPENFNAVWVKNEWSRYLALIKNGAKKTLIPAYRDMDPYDLPEEFSHLMAQDMSKLGFMQDLIRGIKKLLADGEPKQSVKETVVVQNTSGAAVTPLLKRAFKFLEDGNWKDADEYCEKVLDQDPENAQAYLGKLMAECKVRNRDQLADCAEPFDNSNNYKKAMRFGDKELTDALSGYIVHIKERNENNRKTGIYNAAIEKMNSAVTENAFKEAANELASIGGFKDADEKRRQCLEKAEECRKNAIYDSAINNMTVNTIKSYEAAIDKFESIRNWRSAYWKIIECRDCIAEIKRKEEANRIAAEKAARKKKKISIIALSAAVAAIAIFLIITKVIIPNNNYNAAVELMESGEYEQAITAFEALDGYKDSADKITECNYGIAVDLMDVGKFNEAISAFEALDGYEDSADKITECNYGIAVELKNAGRYEEAVSAFRELGSYKDSNEQIENCYIEKYGLEKWEEIKNIKAGDTYIFGSYEQDNNTSNGTEEIEWLVLDRQDNKILVISKYGLDAKPYNEEYYDYGNWETCTLRSWLNNEFYNTAFSADEQKQIQSTDVSADENPKYDTNPGNNTTDNVFLLSINEAEKYFSFNSSRRCAPTDYAIAQDPYTRSGYKVDGKATCMWWLRSSDQDYAAGVLDDGDVVYIVYSGVCLDYGCVRPALWINLYS